MRDPLSWSFPIGRLFGATLRVHVLFPATVAALLLRVAFKEGNASGLWIEALWVLVILFFSVILHELGHCCGARLVDGDATEIVLWPLGGLATVDVPNTARANFIATAAGPAANFVVCLAAAVGLFAWSYSAWPLFNPRWDPLSVVLVNLVDKTQYGNSFSGLSQPLAPGPVLVARIFWINWFLFLINLLPGFPLDGSRLLQSILWPSIGYTRATVAAIYVGFVTAMVVGIYSVATWDPLPGFLCLFIWVVTSRQQWILLEAGGEDALFGYDFSQGYTSLEREPPGLPRRRRPNLWQRWSHRRAAQKLLREAEQREAEERRMDQLLQKVQQQGLQALSEEERRFLTRVSAKYRNRQ
jgi:stage IV sporulation protein FB